MKILLFVSLLTLFLAARASAQEEEPENQPEWFLSHPYFHHFHPHYPFFPHPHPHFRFPLPSPPPTSSATPYEDNVELLKFPSVHRHRVSEGQRECYKAVHSQAMVACLSDIHSFILTHKMNVGSKCCSGLERIEHACQPLVKHPLTVLDNIIAHHCSAPAPSPSN